MQDSISYCTLSHTFFDLWQDKEISLTFRFAKPSVNHIRRLNDTVGKNSAQAMRNLLVDTIHPEEKDIFVQELEEHAGIVTTFSNALIKGMGISSELGK